MIFQTCGVHFDRLFEFMEENVDLQSKSMSDFKGKVKYIYRYRYTKWAVVDLPGKHYFLFPTAEYTSLLHA